MAHSTLWVVAVGWVWVMLVMAHNTTLRKVVGLCHITGEKLQRKTWWVYNIYAGREEWPDV